jgi:SAM-dependent methyltransferase
MGVIDGRLAIGILTWLSPNGENGHLDGRAYANRSKLEILLGPEFFAAIQNKIVIDFGCGRGEEAIEMAGRGARRVIGIDIRPRCLSEARARAAAAGVADRCVFAESPDELADVIVSLDSFEHFENPAAILEIMARYLKPDGKVMVSFGPTWYHPYGGHVFALFPWAHLVFTERALLAWRKRSHPTQTARTIEECGLNKMTIRRFEMVIDTSPFRLAHFEARPIRGCRRLWNSLTREFLTSVVQATLVAKRGVGAELPMRQTVAV